jgi:ribosomal protein L7Ae-like RNA K-turn-binding protein
MLSALKKEKKDYLKILSTMRGSEYLVFGIKMVLEDISKVHFVVIASDISEKNDVKLVKILKEKNISYTYFSTKERLGAIFNKGEVNVVGIKSKRVARGLL